MITLKKFKKISNEGFVQNVIMLVGSTIFAQGLMIAILPILTRIYSPSDFGLLGVYTSIIAIFSTCACLRYDIPISLVGKQRTADTLLFISIIISLIFNLFLFFFIFLFDNAIIELLGDNNFKNFLYLVPLGVFSVSIFTALTFWKSKKNHFRNISIVRCKQAVLSGIVQIFGGYLFTSTGALFLIIGYLINSFWGIANFLLEFFNIFKFKKKHVLVVLNKFKIYPKYSTFEALLNNLAIYFPLLFIAKYISIEETGFLALAIKLMQIPMKLVGNSIAQVFAVSAAEEYRLGNLNNFTYKTLNRLVTVGVGPIMFIGIVAPEVCQVVFGSEWKRIGILITIMIPWFAMQFLASPIAMILHITNNQKQAMLIQIINVVIRIFPLFFIVVFDSKLLTLYYAFSGFVFYLFYLIKSLSLASLSIKSLIFVFVKNIKFLFLWILFGLILKFVLSYIM